MVQSATAEIIAIGTEILLGEITDTNSVHLAQVLRDHGINLYYMTSVGDNTERIASAIKIALNRAQIVITCGGLGPTVDDVTRQGIADAVGRPLEYQETLFQAIADRFSAYRVKMTENNRRQAYLPSGAIAVENPVGTAPAFIVEQNGKCVISLPGVPREMKFLMQEKILPYLREHYEIGIIKSRTLRVAGIGESALDTLIGAELLEQSNPTVGLAAHHGVIDIRITAKAHDAIVAGEMLQETETRLMQRVGQHVFGADKDELETVLLDLLREKEFTLSVIEAGITDAVIAKLQNRADAQSIHFRQFATPEDAAAAYNLNIQHGLRVIAENIAQSTLADSSVDAVIAILSLPDVDESEDKSEATAVVVATQTDMKSRIYGFGAKNDLTGNWVSRWSMAYIWRSLMESLR